MKKIFIKTVIFLVAFPIIYHVIALGLIFSQSPASLTGEANAGLDFSKQKSNAGKMILPDLQKWQARDGRDLFYRHYESSQPTEKRLILLHGSGWHSLQFAKMASDIAKSGVADVITPDLRGHGFQPVKRGDVDYIGQFENDLTDLFANLKSKLGDKSIILGGHSSGGGLVVRFAGSPQGYTADAFILLAPYLKYNAPTTRENSGGWARPLTRRIIGLSMLNQVGITALNDLPAIQFNFPKSVLEGSLGATATDQYSYRLNTSYAPRDDYEADLSAMTQPFLLVAGMEDEAFYAEQYETVISAKTKSGVYHLLPEQGHLGIVDDNRTIDLMTKWLGQL